MLFNFQGPIRCRFRRQLRYYITHFIHCQHLSAIFFSNLPRSRVFWVKLSTSCGKCTAFVPFAARPCSALPLCAFPHKIRAFCTTKAAFLCGKRQIVGRFFVKRSFWQQKTRVRRDAGFLSVLDFEGLYCNLNYNQFNCREKPAKEVFAPMSGWCKGFFFYWTGVWSTTGKMLT